MSVDEQPIETRLYQRPQPTYLPDLLARWATRLWQVLARPWRPYADAPFTPPEIPGLRVVETKEHVSLNYRHDWEVIYEHPATGARYSARDAWEDEDVSEHGIVPFWQFRSIQDLRPVDRLRPDPTTDGKDGTHAAGDYAGFRAGLSLPRAVATGRAL
jgi:hypothetical protein